MSNWGSRNDGSTSPLVTSGRSSLAGPTSFYSPQLTPSTPSAPSLSYAYPGNASSHLPPQFNLPSGVRGGGGGRMAQSGASTPIPTSPVVGPLARSSSMMDIGSFGQAQSQRQGQGQGARWGAGRGGFGMGMGMSSRDLDAGEGSSPIEVKSGNNSTASPNPSAHPSSYDPVPAQLGIGTSSTSSGSGDPNSTTAGESAGLGMSISPPSWGTWGNNAIPVGSYGMGSWGGVNGASGGVGSLQMGQSFGRERDRELEARYVKDFSCCGKQLNGLHELLEHYEEEHANLSPDARFAALSAAHAPVGQHRPSFNMPSVQTASPRNLHNQGGDDVPAPPGMMDIEMEDDTPGPSSGSNGSSGTGARMYNQGTGGFGVGGFGLHGQPSQHQHQHQPQQQPPWATAFRPVYAGTTGIPPSLLTMPVPSLPQPQQQLYQPTPQSGYQTQTTSIPYQQHITTSQPPSRASTPLHNPKVPLSAEELEARAIRKAQRKAERQAQAKRAAENGEHESGEEGGNGEIEKKFPCPIEGCGKVYKQANGLKYHLTRSINSGHGNVAEMGLPAGALGAG